MKKMKGTVYLLAMVALACLTLQVPAIEAAPSINLFDYFFCRGIGDSWTYKYTEYVTPPVVPLFTVTTFLINSGEYEGKIYWGILSNLMAKQAIQSFLWPPSHSSASSIK